MASIIDDGGGKKRIEFINRDGNRKRIRLGKFNARQAAKVREKIEDLLAVDAGGSDVDLRAWAEGIPDKLHKRIAAVGLLKPRSQTAATLGAFLSDVFQNMPGKPATREFYGHTRRCLVTYFGENKTLREIEPADAEKWRSWLKTANIRDKARSEMSDSTVNRRVSVARTLFSRAVKWKLIRENPFADVKVGNQINKSRMFFITRDMADAVMEKCPDTTWKLLFALSRYGGLRCPSEHLALKWSDIDFEHKQIRVISPKTEHHEGKGERLIPMFPELEPLLTAALAEAPEGAEHVIAMGKGASVNLRTRLQRIIRRANLTPWPKLWHNLRASRQTELAETFPIQVVCEWIGNSRAVALDHYLQVTKQHFERAVSKPNSEQQAQKQAQQGVHQHEMMKRPPVAQGVNHSKIQAATLDYSAVQTQDWAIQDSNL